MVNKTTGLPGEGVGFFLRDWGDFATLPRRRQKEIVAGAHALVFAYPRWEELLKAVSLRPVTPDFSNVVRMASQPSDGNGGGECAGHRDLKIFVAQNPMCIGLPSATPAGSNEVPLPSGDCLDVSFHVSDEWVAAEVKSSLSNTADIVRGLFQCVKYRAVMAAAQAAQGLAREARAVLVLEGQLGQELIPLRNILGVEVFEKVSPKPSR